MCAVKIVRKEATVNVYAASVALLWSTALRAAAAPPRAAPPQTGVAAVEKPARRWRRWVARLGGNKARHT
jgi:hypothetical protein